MYFEKQKGEEVVEIIKKSIYTLIPHMLKALALSLPPIYGLLFMDHPVVSVVSLVWLIILLSYVLYHWLVWHFDSYIITNQRVINIDQRSLFSKEVLELSYDKIEDIYHSVDNFAGSLFGYGTVKILPHSSISFLKMDLVNVPCPQDLQKILLELKKEDAKKG